MLRIDIDMEATGKNIKHIAKERKLKTADIQKALGFNTPQSIYKWYRGLALPTIDNLVILAELFDTTIDDIIKRR